MGDDLGYETRRANRAERERDEAYATLARATIVAEAWRDSIMDGQPKHTWAAHPLAMVLAALSGELDPVQCGIDGDDAVRFAEARP